MPDKLTILERCGRRHHAVDPFRVVQSLIDVGRAVVPLPVHIEVVRALEGYRAAATDFFIANGTGKADLAGHRGTADDGLVKVELLDEGRDAADVGVYVQRLDVTAS